MDDDSFCRYSGLRACGMYPWLSPVPEDVIHGVELLEDLSPRQHRTYLSYSEFDASSWYRGSYVVSNGPAPVPGFCPQF